MAAHTLAPSKNDQQAPNDSAVGNPFATPSINPSDLPTPPEPVAHALLFYNSAHPYYYAQHTRPTTLHGGAEYDQPTYSYKSESMSSAGGSSAMTPTPSIDLEKKARRGSEPKKQHETSRDRQWQGRDQSGRDPEKAGQRSLPGSRDRSRRVEEERVAYMEDDNAQDPKQVQEKQAGRILFFLSGPCMALSFLNTMWTLISLVITTLAQPVRLCARRPSFGQQLGGLLGPALNLQLKSIYTPLPPHADEDTSYRPGMLLVVQLLSPFLSLGIMFAAWVVAIFWFASAVVGDPSGTDKRDDGKESVLALRNWWERWLVKSIRED